MLIQVAGAEVIHLGSGSRWDVSCINGYQNFTVDNFFFKSNSGRTGNNQYLYDSQDRTFDIYGNSSELKYDNNTGILTYQWRLRLKCGGKVSECNGGAADVYLITDTSTIKNDKK